MVRNIPDGVTIPSFSTRQLLSADHTNTGRQQHKCNPQHISAQQMQDLHPKRSQQNNIRKPKATLQRQQQNYAHRQLPVLT